MLTSDLRRLVAVALVLTTTFVTMPLSAADFSTPRPVIGSVSAVGPVDLRGVGISQEGTLFAGDSIRAREKGYAKVLMGTGSKIELAEKTDVKVSRDEQGVKIAMNTGTVGFTARTLLRIDVLPFEVTATDDAAGNVAIMSSTTAGVRAISGKVSVRNLKTSESFVLMKGQERLLGLTDGAHSASLAELASTIPGPIPAPGPQTPAGKTGGGIAMDSGAWLAVIGGAAVAGIAVWGLVVALNNRDDIKDLTASVNKLSGTITANQAANAAALKNISNAIAIANATSQQQAALAAASAALGQAQLAFTASGNTAAAAQAAALLGQIATSLTALGALQTRLQALQATGDAAGIAAALSTEETQRGTTNTQITTANTLFRNNPGPGVPAPNLGTVAGPTVASASVPV